MKTHRFKQREIRGLKDMSLPAVWLFTDTETKVKVVEGKDLHMFYMGWIFACEKGWESDDAKVSYHYFSRASGYLSFIEEFVREKGQVYLCGHNIFFDLQASGFFPFFHSRSWKLDYLYDQGLSFILKISKGSSTLTVCSTTNWFDCSLKKLGDMIGLKKMSVSFDTVSSFLLKNYCYRDTQIVMEAVRHYISFIKENSLGKFRLTKASQAFTAYRTGFLHARIFTHDEQVIHSLERYAYMGGRTEAYFIGKMPPDEYVTLDINSMYPFVMSAYKYPAKLVCYITGEFFERYTAVLKGFLMIAECEVSTPEPVFSIKYKNKTVFPVGSFTAFLCTEGIKYGLERGYIKKFIQAAVYLPCDLFTGYVEFFKSLRDKYTAKNNEVMVKLCKYFHNSLYGKWGERQIVTEKFDAPENVNYYRSEIYDMEKGGIWIETFLFGAQILQHYEGETSHSCPAIAAHVTENGRLMLWDIIKKIGVENVLYCDTDSIIINKKHINKIQDIIDERRMGALKVQAEFRELEIGGAKNYRTDQVRHIKGIPATAKEVSPGVFEYMHFSSMCMCLKECTSVGVPAETVKRRLKSAYDKGVVTSPGRVLPLLFPLS